MKDGAAATPVRGNRRPMTRPSAPIRCTARLLRPATPKRATRTFLLPDLCSVGNIDAPEAAAD